MNVIVLRLMKIEGMAYCYGVGDASLDLIELSICQYLIGW